MAEGHSTTTQPVSLETYYDEDTELTHYLVVDNEDLDPAGEPVIFEVSATEFYELSQSLENLSLDN